MPAIGMIEIQGVTAAIDALDIMLKVADVRFLTWERKLGGRLVTVIIQGETAAVNEAVATACMKAIRQPCARLVLPNPHKETIRIIQMSVARGKYYE